MSDLPSKPRTRARIWYVRRHDWLPDVADHRDYTLSSRRVRTLLARLEPSHSANGAAPQVDWRAFDGPMFEPCASTAVEACVAMIQQCERRASGRLLQLSRTFLQFNAARESGPTAGGHTLRSVLKAARRCGLPPERYWPAERADETPDPFAYRFGRYCASLRYVRLDGPRHSGEETLRTLRALLAAGFGAVFGFAASSSVGNGPDISFPTASDELLGGLAVTAVGYDDRLRIRSDKGALLVRNTWCPQWGDNGYGWLPYAYVRQRLASDFWTLFKPSWVRSGEFDPPAL